MGITLMSGFGGVSSYYSRAYEIPTVTPEEVKKQDELRQEMQPVMQAEMAEQQVPDNRSRSADLENISLTFNKEETYDYLGSESNLSDLDIILEKWQKNTGILLPGYKIDKIKKEIVSAVEFIKQDKKDNTIMDFYYSEYPMGAIHRKGVRKENGGWLLFQYDYDKKPSYREVPLSADDFIETFILFEHQNG